MVGAVRFELTTSCTRNKRASQATLRPEPEAKKMQAAVVNCNNELEKTEEKSHERPWALARQAS